MVQAWARLERAFTKLNQVLERDYGLTGQQLAVLRTVADWAGPGQAMPLAALRERLFMHPATIGQMLDRLADRGLVVVAPDPQDRRRRLIHVTEQGGGVLATAPLAGPVRLRHVQAEPERLGRLAEALDDAITLFGLQDYGPERR
ncbi:MarR family transcriptional regulator [Streptomyces sp. NPDC002812]|uniref:MarR family transcriptional regulator n=1 Tax=Streptomyces sp. NPDC002812 TaxID=3154434 RepID=UPI0033244902